MTDKEKVTPAIRPVPPKQKDFAVKIERAKEIREATIKMREGKPAAFSLRRARH